MTLVPTANPAVSNNTAQLRYEIRHGDDVAGVAFYAMSGNTVVFTHTEIREAYEGQGLGSHLAKAALDDVRSHHQAVRALCPFIAAYIERHPEYADLIQGHEQKD